MAWDFTADSDIQLEMSKILKEKADNLDKEFSNLYTQIGPGNLGTHWVGSDYDSFNTGCDGYKQALKDMTDSVRMYADHFESVADGTDALASSCISIVLNMTTRGAGGSGTGGNGSNNNGTNQNGNNNNGNNNNGTGGNGTNPNGTGNNQNGNNNNGTGGNGTNPNGTGNNTGGQGGAGSTVTKSWTTYQDACDAGYSNVKTPHEFARGGYDKEKYGTYEAYLAAMQERYVGSTYEQDMNNRNNGQGGAGNTNNNGTGGNGTNQNGNNNNATGGNSTNQNGTGTTGTNTQTEDKPGFWERQGQRFVDDWNGFTSDVSNSWSDANGLISGVYAIAETGAEFSGLVADTAINAVQTGTDMIQSGVNWLFDAGDTRSTNGNYWDNVGEDFAENFDFSTCDNFAEGLGVAICAVPSTIVDAGQFVVNVAADGIEAVGDGLSWVGDKITDGVSALGSWIFG